MENDEEAKKEGRKQGGWRKQQRKKMEHKDGGEERVDQRSRRMGEGRGIKEKGRKKYCEVERERGKRREVKRER